MIKVSLLWQVGLIANVKLHFFITGSSFKTLNIPFSTKWPQMLNVYWHLKTALWWQSWNWKHKNHPFFDILKWDLSIINAGLPILLITSPRTNRMSKNLLRPECPIYISNVNMGVGGGVSSSARLFRGGWYQNPVEVLGASWVNFSTLLVINCDPSPSEI